MKSQLVIARFLVAAIALLSTSAAQSVRFVRDWETAIAAYNQQGASVCVDRLHNVHVITSDGLWATLDPSGKVIRKTEEDVLQGAWNVACLSSENQVVVAVPHSYRLYIFFSDHRPVLPVTVQEGFQSVISADDTKIRLFAPHQGYLFQDIDQKTGATIGLLGSRAQSAIPSGPIQGEASTDEKRGLLLFVTHNPETVSVFDSTGRLMLSKPILGDVRPRDDSQSFQIPGAPMTNDRAFGIFRLSDGRYLVNINRVDMSGDRKSVTSDLVYQIFDGQFNLVGHASAEEIGSILASDGQGAVYALGGGRTLRIVKGHLQ